MTMLTEEVTEAQVESAKLVSQIQSLCMECHESGVTKLLLTKIPHFKEIMLMSFECDHCGFKNCNVEGLSELMDFGLHIRLTLESMSDFNRQVVRAEYCTARIPKLDFDIMPSYSSVTTVEDILKTAFENLSRGQVERQKVDSTCADKIDVVINRLDSLLKGKEFPFDLELDDPSGNSYIEKRFPNNCSKDDNLFDAQLIETKYSRTASQLKAMGFYPPEDPDADKKDKLKYADIPSEMRPSEETVTSELEHQTDENVMSIPTPCLRCARDGSTKMCEIDIPGFRKCILMSFNCDFCGARSSEVKPSQAYGSQGRKWTLRVETSDDLNRDVLKSDTAALFIPEIDFEASAGSCGGVFTTVEGLLLNIVKSMESNYAFVVGDSAEDSEQKRKLGDIVESLKRFASDPLHCPFTLILDDSADLSYIGRGSDFRVNDAVRSIAASQALHDDQLTQELYERNDEQNEILGISDMIV